MKSYQRFKKWVEKKKIQKRLDNFMVLWVVLITVISIGLLNTDFSSVLGLSTKKETPSIILPSPTIAIPTDTPTPTIIYIQPTLTPQIQQQATSKIDCVGPDGKHSQKTQKECDDFNTAWGRNKSTKQTNIQSPSNITNPSTKSTTKADLISCSTKMGTFQLTQYECSEYNRILSQYVECATVFSHYSWLTAEECEQYKIQDAAFVDKLNNIANPSTPTPTPDNSHNNGQCKMYADQWYTNQGTQCSGSCAEAIKQLAYPEYQQKLKDCDSQYPI